jgi:ketosteroid isomerase-like protein
MTSENVAFVRSIYEAWERDDYSSTEWADPDIEFVIGDGPDPGIWRGVAGMVEGWRSYLSNWESYRFEVEEYRELDAERVLALIRIKGPGKASGLDLGQMDARGATLLQVRGGRVFRLGLYLDLDRLLADL